MSRRPDTLGSWSGPLDCEGQDTIHSQCLEAGGECSLSPSPPSLSLLCFRPEVCVLSLPGKLPFEESLCQQAAQNMELVISYYCKTRNLHYMADYGWTEILLVLSSIGMNKADLFNCFYAMVAKYIPRHVSLVCQVAGIS